MAHSDSGINGAAAGRWSDFTTVYGLDENDKAGFIGGYTRFLEDDGERVALERGDRNTPEGAGLVVGVLEDEVRYQIVTPWPEAAGTGESLNRTAVDAWGNSAASWKAEAPTPGTTPPCRYRSRR